MNIQKKFFDLRLVIQFQNERGVSIFFSCQFYTLYNHQLHTKILELGD